MILHWDLRTTYGKTLHAKLLDSQVTIHNKSMTSVPVVKLISACIEKEQSCIVILPSIYPHHNTVR